MMTKRGTKRAIRSLGTLTLVLAVAGCGEQQDAVSGEGKSRGRARPIMPVTSDIGRSAMAVAGEVYSKARKDDKNFVISPLSIMTALSLVYAGARGETEKQIARAMQTDLGQEEYHKAFAEAQAELRESTDAGFGEFAKLNLANLFAVQKDYPIEPEFMATATNEYLSEVKLLDFVSAPAAAKDEINSWIEEQTAGKIKDLLSERHITQRTVAAIVNALYLRAEWQSAVKFSEKATRPRPFWVTRFRKVDALTMQKTSEWFHYGESRSLQVLEMWYVGGLRMVVVLPRSRTGLAKIEERLAEEGLQKWVSSLPPVRVCNVEVYLPKYGIENDADLLQILSAMGVTALFNGREADLTGISRKRELFVSDALHRAGIRVNEKGTEAWAATAFLVARGERVWQPPPPPPKIFRADHPFLFFIVDNSSSLILFMGRVMDPTKGMPQEQEAGPEISPPVHRESKRRH